MKTVLEVLRLSADWLKARGIENSRREAEWLLCGALEMERLQLYLDYDRPLLEDELTRCREWLIRRGRGEPLQYIRGYQEFYGCHLKVDRRALIPRQETEWIVAQIVTELHSMKVEEGLLWDLCTGSGCIAVAMKHSFPQMYVVGSDLSADALDLARLNAGLNSVEVEWVQGDFLEAMRGRPLLDYCICNPPYISKAELSSLSPEVVEFEPLLALDGGGDGLDFYRRLSHELPSYLRPLGRLWLEIGSEQGDAVLQLFSSTAWQVLSLQRDLAGHPRLISLVRE